MSDTTGSSSGNGGNGVVLASFLSITLQLLRLSIDVIQTASAKSSRDYKEDHHGAVSSTPAKSTVSKDASYGSLGGESPNEEQDDDATPNLNNVSAITNDTTPLMNTPSAKSAWSSAPRITNLEASVTSTQSHLQESFVKASQWSFRIQAALAFGLWIVWMLDFTTAGVISELLIGTAVIVMGLGAVLTYRDIIRVRFGYLSRALYLLASIILYTSCALAYYEDRSDATVMDELVMNGVGIYGILSLVEVPFVPFVSEEGVDDEGASTLFAPPKKRGLSRRAIITLLKPYFWPDETQDADAKTNRIRAILTWVCVVLSKVCNLVSPILLGWASTELAHGNYGACMKYSIIFAIVGFFASFFKEAQSLVYLKVAQAAFVQLSETAFVHLHSLSLDWHLQKKLGEVIRSLDRGIAACDTLMKYLFLWLFPALVECLVVCLIFATYFAYWPLALAVFYFVWIYIVWTILVTLWRKRFRKAVVSSDNEWHDRCTDSLINFETVKYFTAEDYERKRFGASVQKYQQGSVSVQASLSFLNISQRGILQICLATSLSMAAWGIKQRIDCCIDEHDCDAGVSDCCRHVSHDECPGMEVGDFVAVLTYTLNLFAPLNFLGSVYNAVVMAIIDLGNLSELLAEQPDVTDDPYAIPLPSSNDVDDDPDIAVEFDNVYFHYPTQSPSQGLKGVSFRMKRGTTTAIVGPTGAGKTTISRLFFRFYDVLGGAIRVNGVDVRSVTQESLRSSIGVVPQAASMFNDTIKANIMYGRRDASQAELIQAADDSQLSNFIDALPQGWETVVGDRGLKLSGGEKQRAAIARCLLKDPPFVLLDEATSALDTITENSIQEALDRLGNARTCLVIAHRLGTIRNADNIIVLKDGRVAEEGTHAELLQLNGIYAEMWNMQVSATSATSSQNDLQNTE